MVVGDQVGLRFLSTFSGIEAASVAWGPLGYEPVAFAEVDKFPVALLAHHYPHTPNWGDVTQYRSWPDANVDVLVGGSPCQSFSVAGLRKGLADPRGNLALVYLGIAYRYRPEWLVFENVPGLLSQDEGRAFGAFLGGLAELGYGFAYRVLDAQYVRVDGFGRAVPQRRRRVFVVGRLGDWRGPAAVLFERESLSWNAAPSRRAGQGVARTLTSSTGGCSAKEQQYTFVRGDGCPLNALDEEPGAIAFGGNNTTGPIDVATACRAKGGTGHGDFESETFVAQGVAIRGRDGGDTIELTGDVMMALRTGGGGSDKPHVLAPVAFKASHFTRGKDGAPSPVAPPLSADADKGDQDTLVLADGSPTIAFSCKDYGNDCSDNVSPTLRAMGFNNSNANAGGQLGVFTNWRVRRLTPLECERLQGFPDGYTDIPYRRRNYTPDGPRYKALGNSMAVNVMRWIGLRIQAVHALGLPKGP